MKTKFIHLRYQDDDQPDKPTGNGGATIAYRINERNELLVGLAVCSVNDNFCRKTGREKAKYRMDGKSKQWALSLELAKNEVMTLKDVVQLATDYWSDMLSYWQEDTDEDAPLNEKKPATVPSTMPGV